MKKALLSLLLLLICLSSSCAYLPVLAGKPTDKQILEIAKEEYSEYMGYSSNPFAPKYKYSSATVDGVVIKGKEAVAYVTVFGKKDGSPNKAELKLFFIRSDRGWVFEDWKMK